MNVNDIRSLRIQDRSLIVQRASPLYQKKQKQQKKKPMPNIV